MIKVDLKILDLEIDVKYFIKINHSSCVFLRNSDIEWCVKSLHTIILVPKNNHKYILVIYLMTFDKQHCCFL